MGYHVIDNGIKRRRAGQHASKRKSFRHPLYTEECPACGAVGSGAVWFPQAMRLAAFVLALLFVLYGGGLFPTLMYATVLPSAERAANISFGPGKAMYSPPSHTERDETSEDVRIMLAHFRRERIGLIVCLAALLIVLAQKVYIEGREITRKNKSKRLNND
jgi:hypothetical protein